MDHELSTLDLSSSLLTRRPIERWAAFATATAMIAYGVTRRTMSGAMLAAAATPLAYRGLVGDWPSFLNGHANNGHGHGPGGARIALAGDRGVHVRESIRLETPIEEVFRFWRQLENLPRFMTHLDRVNELSETRSHWVAKGPMDARVEWDAEIVNDVENQVIGWRSLPGSDVVMAGSVAFSPARGGRSTQVSVDLRYEPPAGRAGAWLATIAGREPSQTIREDLRRFKQMLEAGETPRTSRDQI